MPETYERTHTYERVDEHGAVVERVQPIDGDYEDTRLGLLAMEEGSEWRLANAEPEPSTEAEPEPAPARPARARKEK